MRTRCASRPRATNLNNARHALNISHHQRLQEPEPDPLQAALEARNFGQVLEQFMLLDRANQLQREHPHRHPRLPAGRSTRASGRSTTSATARRDDVAELKSLKSADQRLDRRGEAALPGPPPKVRRLIQERRAAEIGRLPAGGRAHAPAAGRVQRSARGRSRRRRSAPPTRAPRATAPPPSTLGEAAASVALGELGTPVRLGRRRARRLRLLGPRLVGLRPGRSRRAAALHRRALGLGHPHLLEASWRQATSSSTTASTTSACTSAEATS